METNDIKETWKAGIERTIKPYPEERLNEMVVNSARKSIKTVYPGTVFRLVIIAAAYQFQCIWRPNVPVRLVVEVLLEFFVFFFFQLLHIYILYDSGIGIAFNASSIFIACTGTYSPLSRTPPPVNENNSLDVFKSRRRFSFESN